MTQSEGTGQALLPTWVQSSASAKTSPREQQAPELKVCLQVGLGS